MANNAAGVPMPGQMQRLQRDLSGLEIHKSGSKQGAGCLKMVRLRILHRRIDRTVGMVSTKRRGLPEVPCGFQIIFGVRQSACPAFPFGTLSVNQTQGS